jgi:hypothetical protein
MSDEFEEGEIGDWRNSSANFNPDNVVVTSSFANQFLQESAALRAANAAVAQRAQQHSLNSADLKLEPE